MLCLAACNTLDEPAAQSSAKEAPPSRSQPPRPTVTPPPPVPGTAGCFGCAPLLVDAGARCPATALLRGNDGDGLPTALEEDAGLDPCKLDSDADGCNDAAEYYLHGCDDPHNAVIEMRCFSGATQTEVVYTLPMDAGPWGHVTLSFPKTAPLQVNALGIAPPGSGAVNGDEFLMVQPGATVRFRLSLEITLSALTRGTLRVMGDGQPIATGKLLITPFPECPIPI